VRAGYSKSKDQPGSYNVGFSYTKAFQEGGETSTEQNPTRMQGVDIRVKRPSWLSRNVKRPLEKWGASVAQRIDTATGGEEWYKKSNPIPTVIGELANLPQLTATYAATGKAQAPSEAMDIQNPVGAAITDMILDPTNLVGAGIAKNLGAGSIKNMVKSAPKGFSKGFKNKELYNVTAKNMLKSEKGPLRLEAPQTYFRATAREKLANLTDEIDLTKEDWDRPTGLTFFGTDVNKAKEYFDPEWTRSNDNVIIQSNMNYTNPYRVNQNEVWTTQRIKELKAKGHDLIYVDPKNRRNVREATEIIPLDKNIIQNVQTLPGYQNGGMSIPGVQGTVVAAPTTLKEAYRKKKKK
jgi:hypothetical protein